MVGQGAPRTSVALHLALRRPQRARDPPRPGHAAWVLLHAGLRLGSSRSSFGASRVPRGWQAGKGFQVALVRLGTVHGTTRWPAVPPLPDAGVTFPAMSPPVCEGVEPRPGVLTSSITMSPFAPSTT